MGSGESEGDSSEKVKCKEKKCVMEVRLLFWQERDSMHSFTH